MVPEPSMAIFLVVTQWPHLVLWIHSYFNGGGATNLIGGGIFVTCYSFSTFYILTRPRLAIIVGTLGLFLTPHFGAFDGLSKAGYALASLCHFIRLRQIMIDDKAFLESTFIYRYKFLSWVGSDLRTARRVGDTERRELVSTSLLERCISLLLCVVCHLSLEKRLPFIIWGDFAGGWACIVTRWLLAGVFFYNSLHMLDLIYRVPLLGFEGIHVVATHDNPIMATNLSDFWGRKWDKAVQMMLKDVVYTPIFDLYGLQAAVWLTFAASGVLHVYALLWAGCSWLLCGYMLVFFILQPILLELDRKFKLPWFPLLSSTAPLFLEPFLTIAGW